jgi:plasmid stability protein
MAQLVVRNLEERVKERLRRRARQNGRSMEEEARDILRNALVAKKAPSEEGAGTQLAKVFAGIGIDFDIPEIRGQEVRPAKFEE